MYVCTPQTNRLPYSIKWNHFHFHLSSSLPIVSRSGWCTAFVDYELKNMRYDILLWRSTIYGNKSRQPLFKKKKKSWKIHWAKNIQQKNPQKIYKYFQRRVQTADVTWEKNNIYFLCAVIPNYINYCCVLARKYI